MSKLRKLKKNIDGFSNLLPAVLAVVITFAIIFVGAFVNGEINQSLEDSFPAAASRSLIQNESLQTLDNISTNWDSSLDIVQVVIIISLLASAVGAIFLFTRFR